MTPSADQNGGIGGDSRVLFFDDFAEGDLATVLVIGAGGVGSVAVHKMAMLSDIFSDITLASRRLGPCEDIQKAVAARTGKTIDIAQLDADNVAETVALIDKVQPQLVVNLALPYQDLAIMDACLETGVHYLDTANYEPRDEAKFEYHWQWAYQDRFCRKRLDGVAWLRI